MPGGLYEHNKKRVAKHYPLFQLIKPYKTMINSLWRLQVVFPEGKYPPPISRTYRPAVWITHRRLVSNSQFLVYKTKQPGRANQQKLHVFAVPNKSPLPSLPQLPAFPETWLLKAEDKTITPVPEIVSPNLQKKKLNLEIIFASYLPELTKAGRSG